MRLAPWTFDTDPLAMCRSRTSREIYIVDVTENVVRSGVSPEHWSPVLGRLLLKWPHTTRVEWLGHVARRRLG